jgi:hypothetical protein
MKAGQSGGPEAARMCGALGGAVLHVRNLSLIGEPLRLTLMWCPFGEHHRPTLGTWEALEWVTLAANPRGSPERVKGAKRCGRSAAQMGYCVEPVGF